MTTAPTLFVGTSGYSFADWVGPFYPPLTRPSEFLEYYARHFHAVELNSTYYRIPSPRVIASIERKTPAGFRFVVKLNQAMTHERSLAPALVSSFQAAVQPLRDAGKHHGLLAQFPWAFRRDDAAKSHLERLREAFGDEPLWVEFRHASWMHPKLPEWLRERRIGYCAVDEPALPNLVPPVVHLTSDSGYVRFHGRNAANWWASTRPGGAAGGDRYDWDYSEPELREWLGKISDLASQARQTYLFFNNCHAGQAAHSARLMEELLQRARLPI